MRYPDANLILLAGSVVRQQAKPGSDLDIIVLGSQEAPYRESFLAHDWPVEAFVHTSASLELFCQKDIERRRPSLPQMLSESILIRGDLELAEQVKTRALTQLTAGPKPKTRLELDQARYALTDLLEDFEAQDVDTALFILPQLLSCFFDFFFDSQNLWRASSKWIPREIKKHNPDLHQTLKTAILAFHKENDATLVISLIDRYLTPFGGRLFAGFTLGRDDV